MKKIVSVIALTVMLISVQPVFAITNPMGCGTVDVGCVVSQFGTSDYGDWVPPKGRILYFGDSKRFQVDLYFDQAAVDFYDENPWAGLEIDIIPIEGSLSMINAGTVSSDSINSKPLRDTIVGDGSSGTRGITVTNPSAIDKGFVSFVFALKDNPSPNTIVEANIQLVANAFDASFVTTIWNNNSPWWAEVTYWRKWFPAAVVGNIAAYAMLGGGEKVFSYFSMANAYQGVKTSGDNPSEPFYVNASVSGEGMYWTSRGNSGAYAVKCGVYDSHVTLDMPTLIPTVYNVHTTFFERSMQDALNQLINSGVPMEHSGDATVNIFTEGYHTHIIHPTDFRCSNNLCWSPSLDTSEPDNQRNCYNASNWYQISNGNYNGTHYSRDKYQMCAEVYSDLDKDDDRDGYTENQGDADDANPYVYPTSDTGSGDDGVNGNLDSNPDISIDSFRIRNVAGGDWEHSVGANLNWGESLYVKGKLVVCNESQLEAKDIDSDYRIEDNKDFDDDDTKVDQDSAFDLDSGECTEKNMTSIKIQVSSDGQSVITSGPDGSRTMPVSNNFVKVYFFSDVEEKGRSNGDDDISSETNDKEHGVARITVKDPGITANFSSSVISGTVPLEVSFNDISSGLVRNRNWYFGDGATSTSTSPSHTYSLPGVYTTTLAIRNKDHANSKSVTIVVNDIPPLEEPPSFRRADVNDDGVIDITDKDLVFNKSLMDEDQYPDGWVESSGGIVGDVNCSGNVTTGDAMLISRYIKGLGVIGTAWCATIIDFEDYCHETAEMLTNGGWGWNPIQGIGCVPESQNFCHSNDDGSNWGWNPYTQTSCELSGEDNDDNNNNNNNDSNQNLVQNADFSDDWSGWTNATWNVTSSIDIFDGRAVITLIDNSNGGDAKLFHDEIAVTAGNYTFGATITNNVEVTAMLYLKKADGSDEWSWSGVIAPLPNEQTVTFSKTLSSDVTTARVIMSIKDPGELVIDDYFLIKE